jgi:hypothetical protein
MKGGGKPYLPIPADVTDPATFQANFDLVSITAHGSQDGTAFLVPENVFICFRGPSGATIERRRHQDAVLNQFRYLNPGETVAQYHERIYTGLRDRTLFSEFLAPTNDPFAPGSMSIYEPGDVIQNIGLQMHNLAYPYGLIGIWKVPLPHEYLQELNTLNQSYDDTVATMLPSDADLTAVLQAEGKPVKNIPILIEQTKKIIKKQVDALFSEGELAFSQKPENAQHWLGLLDENPSLYDVLQTIRNSVLGHEPLVTKKYTFIVIEACREAFELQLEGLLSGAEHVAAMEYRGTAAERQAELEKATSKFYIGPKNKIANRALAIAKGLKPARRRSLAVRNVPGICYRSLFLLSKDSLRTLKPTTPELQRALEALLTGRRIPSTTLDALTAPAQVANIALENVNYSQRFYPGEIVKVVGSDTFAIVKDVIVVPGAPSAAAAGGASSSPSIRYLITQINPLNGSITTVQVPPGGLVKTGPEERENFEGLRMSLNNASQKALSFERAPLAVASASASAPGATTIPIGMAYDKGFYIQAALAPYKDKIEKQLESFSGAKARRSIQLLTGDLKGTKGELLPELLFNPEMDKVILQIELTTGKVIKTTNPAVFKMAGGARKTRKAKGPGQSKKFLRGKFCRCIKKVSKSVKARKGKKEQAAIGICVKSVLGTRKRTLYKFSCKKGKLETQDPFHRR